MKESEKYLARLKYEKDDWQKPVDELPGDSINCNHQYYRRATNAANKYAAAKHMMDLMQAEASTQPRTA